MGMGSQQVCRGWTQIRAQEWTGEGCMGRVGIGRMMGEQGETWKKVETQKERQGHRNMRAQR